jgi:acetolactate decarboxylase
MSSSPCGAALMVVTLSGVASRSDGAFFAGRSPVPSLTAVIPSSVAHALSNAVSARASSLDSIVTTALEQYFGTNRHRAYQFSTSAALVEGIASDGTSSRTLLANGDFGLGTFEHLDGEMIVLDGQPYQALGDGTVKHRQDEFRVPFAIVCKFQPDDTFDVHSADSLSVLEAACDPHRESDNLFYALRIDGTFQHIHTRAVLAAAEGTTLLDAAKTQPEFQFSNTEGTLVSIWSPRYSSSFSVPGYHVHFISRDRTKGGHVLGCSGSHLHVAMQVLTEYDVRLPESGAFLTQDLSGDTKTVLGKVE